MRKRSTSSRKRWSQNVFLNCNDCNDCRMQDIDPPLFARREPGVFCFDEESLNKQRDDALAGGLQHAVCPNAGIGWGHGRVDTDGIMGVQEEV